jgi:fatty-acyl-CoA synthase
MLTTMMQVPLSLNTLLERAGKFFGDTAVVTRMPDKSYQRSTYTQIYKRARQLAQALRHQAGILPGQAVATLCWNHHWHLECYFGIPAAGAVLHTLNLRLSPEDLAYIIEDADDRVLIVDDILLPIWEKVRPLLKKAPPRIIVVPYSGANLPAEAESFESFIAADASNYSYPELDENSPSGMCYTSGTTGHPKGVVYSHRSMVLHAIMACMPDLFNISCRDRILIVTPMFHANAWAIPFSTMMVGGALMLPGPHLGGEDLLDMMEVEQTTLALGVPTIWMMVLQALEQPTRKRSLYPGMRMLVGGAAVPVSLVQRYASFNMQVLQGWGMTELSPLGSFTLFKPSHDKLSDHDRHELVTMQGVPTPLVEVRLFSEDGREMPWDGTSIGEIQVRGPYVTGSYHGVPNDDSKFTADGWLRTGDMATMSSEGYLRIVDRSKDLIKSGGEWISSVDLENLVMGHPEIAEAAVVAIPHAKWDERPLVVAVRRPGGTVDAAGLRTFLQPKLARFQLPDDYEFVDVLPKTSTGKFLKSKLREMFKDRPSKTAS